MKIICIKLLQKNIIFITKYLTVQDKIFYGRTTYLKSNNSFSVLKGELI